MQRRTHYAHTPSRSTVCCEDGECVWWSRKVCEAYKGRKSNGHCECVRASQAANRKFSLINIEWPNDHFHTHTSSIRCTKHKRRTCISLTIPLNTAFSVNYTLLLLMMVVSFVYTGVRSTWKRSIFFSLSCSSYNSVFNIQREHSMRLFEFFFNSLFWSLGTHTHAQRTAYALWMWYVFEYSHSTNTNTLRGLWMHRQSHTDNTTGLEHCS